MEKEAVKHSTEVPFYWNSANLYFLLVDRFNNVDVTNDNMLRGENETAVLRGFEGGDLKGITQKIKEGYFNTLGINAIWMSPIVEQIHGATDEGTGLSEGYHGYWARDWTAIDPNYGTAEDLEELVETAHAHGIRILLDAVINHTGPVTFEDSVWPNDWVRTGPKCMHQDYESTVTCTLVENLPDIKTESDNEVDLPEFLVEKWKDEGRYAEELAELNAFFSETGYPRAPRFYIMKWLSDYITDYGIDGYRVDTAKHTEAYVWSEFREVCDSKFALYKAENPEKILDNNKFYLVGEVYNYSIGHGRNFDYGDRVVDFYDFGFNSLINFEFRWNAEGNYEDIFSRYDQILHGDLAGFGVMNYLDSHDDGNPFDVNREKTHEAARKLLLSPGTTQIYYGDETARPLLVEGAVGDANLRSLMNWEELDRNQDIKQLYNYYGLLGRFRANHPAIGAGMHNMISEMPYVFSRTYTDAAYSDVVVVALDLVDEKQEISIGDVFIDGTVLVDNSSKTEVVVTNGKVELEVKNGMVLLAEKLN
ncbi:MAG: alpha-amylase family glycosyl hydrolase [Flavobacteriaceae bacterium]